MEEKPYGYSVFPEGTGERKHTEVEKYKVTVLPSFMDKEGNKWTVDAKLREFRRVYRDEEYNLKIEFVSFDTEKGKLLMSEAKLREVL